MLKTLDKYILTNFTVSVVMCTLVTLSLRIVTDLFVNIDEFSEIAAKADISWVGVAAYVVSYYAHNTLIFFQEMGGVILLMAALFSLARMNQTNELVAAMAGGMSLYRLVTPVIAVGMTFAFIGAINQEFIIPQVKDQLVLSRDEVPGMKTMKVELIPDEQQNIWYSRHFEQATGQMDKPLILARDIRGRLQAKIASDTAIKVPDAPRWRLLNASMVVLSNSRSRGALDSGFILTGRPPAQLARSQGEYDAADGLAVRFDSQMGSDVLLEPRFDVFAPAGTRKKPRVICTMQARCAVFESHKRSSGYRLIGRPLLRAPQIPNWRRFCKKLLAGEKLGPDRKLGRLWGSLDSSLKETVRRCVVDKIDTIEPVRQNLVKAVNDALERDVIAELGEYESALAAADDPASVKQFNPYELLPASVARLLSGGALSRKFTVAYVNRVALDAAMADELIPCGGEMLMMSSMTAEQIVLRQSGKWMDYMSSRELARLVRTGNAPDPAAASLAMHSHFTTPIAWVIMLLLGIPFVVSRERRLKSSTLLCLLLVGGFHAFVFVSRYLGDHICQFIGNGLEQYSIGHMSPVWGPIIGAWLPMVIFIPVAVLLLESMHSMNPYDRNETVAELLIAPGGRLRRRLFWRWAPILAGAMVAAFAIDMIWIGHAGLITSIVVILASWPLLMLHFKRCHDRNRSGLFVLTPLIPLLLVWLIFASTANILSLTLVGWMFMLLFGGIFISTLLWVLAETWIRPGHAGLNAYGHDPRQVAVDTKAE